MKANTFYLTFEKQKTCIRQECEGELCFISNNKGKYKCDLLLLQISGRKMANKCLVS